MGKNSISSIFMKLSKTSLWFILIVIVLGMIAGTLSGKESGLWGLSFYSIYEFIGQLFIQALMLVSIPLIISSVMTGIAKIAQDNSFKRIISKVFATFFVLNLCALFVGVLITFVFQKNLQTSANLLLAAKGGQMAQTALTPAAMNFSFSQFLLQIIPSNLIEAFYNMRIIGLVFFSLLFGYVMTKIEPKASEVLQNFWKGVFQTMIGITELILKFLPLGVFCLVAKQFAATGLETLGFLGIFFFISSLGLFTYMFLVLPCLLFFVAKVHPLLHFKAMLPAIVTAFSTTSTSATLPVTIDCLENRAKVSAKLSHVIPPLGASLNMAATVLFSFIAVAFIATAYGLPASLYTYSIIGFLSLFLSMGVAGIPSGCLVIVMIILKTINLPPESIALIIALDRFLDMFRTTTNVFTGSCSTVIVAKLENEKGILAGKE
jgi:Na+/H+-dicarboxylate symporter